MPPVISLRCQITQFRIYGFNVSIHFCACELGRGEERTEVVDGVCPKRCQRMTTSPQSGLVTAPDRGPDRCEDLPARKGRTRSVIGCRLKGHGHIIFGLIVVLCVVLREVEQAAGNGGPRENVQVRIHPERDSHGNGRALNLAAVWASTPSENNTGMDARWIQWQCTRPTLARITREWSQWTYPEDQRTFAGLGATGPGAQWFLPALQNSFSRKGPD